mgnify:CR=1 FL=1
MEKTKFIAHRGYSGLEKENTLVAFTAAGVTKEFYGIETDVHVTNDNHFIIIHDETTSRVTNNRTNINVEENNFELVRNVLLTDTDNYDSRVDLRIPEMIEYFRICKKYNKVAVCELKQLFTKEQIKEILSIVDSLNMLENTIFISFYLEDLITLREISKTQQAQWLLCEFKEEHLETLLKYSLDVDAHFNSLDKEKIDLCHKNNIKVNIWTVDSQEIADKYASWGVDFITSNIIKEVSK